MTSTKADTSQQQSPDFTLILAGGGTGGHLYPALVIAAELKQRVPHSRILFFSTGRHIESYVLGDCGYEVIQTSAPKLPRLRELPQFALQFPLAIWRSLRLLKQYKPDAVLGLGGYGSVPTGIAASIQRVPLALLNIDSHAGRANRTLSRRAAKVFLQFEQAKAAFPQTTTIVSGCPVRPELFGIDPAMARKQFDLDAERSTLLVLGGSQGAAALNEVMAACLQQGFPDDWQVLHLCGPGKNENLVALYKQAEIPACVMDYCEDMGTAFGAASLVLSRAGASTIAELRALQKPCLLVPFPSAAEDHQTKNAEWLVQQGQAVLLPQDELTAARLFDALQDHEAQRQQAIPVEPSTLAQSIIVDHLLAMQAGGDDI